MPLAVSVARLAGFASGLLTVKVFLQANPTVDMIVVRENSEGEYANNGGRFAAGQPNEVAIQTAVHTRKGVERVLRHGFDLAMLPERRQKLTMVTKSNAQVFTNATNE